jgi:hypothetical protein
MRLLSSKPMLKELIEKCGAEFESLEQRGAYQASTGTRFPAGEGYEWRVASYKTGDLHFEFGKTPEEAVEKLALYLTSA